MKTRILYLSFLALLVSKSVYAVDLTAQPFGKVNAVISSKEPNILHVKNDKITNLTAKVGAIVEDEAASDGSIIFSSLESKPFSILIETEKGYNFTLNAVPKKDISSSSVVIHNLKDKGNSINENVLNGNGWYKSYSGVIAKVFTDLINNRIPDGFVDTRNRDYDIPRELNSFFKVRKTNAWVGNGMRVVRLDITNISSNSIELNERNFWTDGVMAITFYPKVFKLPAGTRVFAYVMLKEVE